MEAYGIKLECFVDDRHKKIPLFEPLGLRHVAFKVDDVEKTLIELGMDDVRISNDWIGRRYAFLKDYDDNTVELHE